MWDAQMMTFLQRIFLKIGVNICPSAVSQWFSHFNVQKNAPRPPG